MEKGFLTYDEMNFLENSLLSNNGITNKEYEELKIKHPYAIIRDDNVVILSSMRHYGLHDSELNKFILTKFGREDYVIDFFYELIYNEGDYTNPHFDKKIVIQTTLVLLSEEFTGGELFINNENVEFNKKRMYINFDGFRDIHSVTKVKSGQRRVLVIMFNKEKKLF